MTPPDIHGMLTRLRALVRDRGSVLVAYSGGVDSALLAKVAALELPGRHLAAVVASESLARRELDDAVAFARDHGIDAAVLGHSELADPRYVANTPDRCYFCRQGMSDVLLAEAQRRGLATVAVGTNMSDLGEWRPGQRALDEAGIWSPLLEVGADKEAVRAMARALGLPVWDRPSMACLSSRIPHGEPVTLAKLRRIEAAEEAVRGFGFRQVRVRALGDVARIEVGADEVGRLQAVADAVTPKVRDLGFAEVQVDQEGYRTGKLLDVTLRRGSSHDSH